jgi:hypothetical protein
MNSATKHIRLTKTNRPNWICGWIFAPLVTVRTHVLRRSAGFQIGRPTKVRERHLASRLAGWETRDTADLEVCATSIFDHASIR